MWDTINRKLDIHLEQGTKHSLLFACIHYHLETWNIAFTINQMHIIFGHMANILLLLQQIDNKATLPNCPLPKGKFKQIP